MVSLPSMDWKGPEGGRLLAGATALLGEQQGLEGSEALPLGLDRKSVV